MSNLYEQIEEEELKIKEEDKEEGKEEAEEEEVAKEPEESTEEEEAEEEGEESDGEEEEEEKQEEEPEQKLDASAYVKMRREKRALQEENEALRAKNNPVVETDDDPEPSKEDKYEEWLEWKDRGIEKKVDEVREWQGKQERIQQQNEMWSGAVKEFQGFESQFQKTTPDYEAAANHMKTRLADSFKLVDPNLTPQEVNTRVSNYILKNAADAARDGYNPAESLYRQSKERFGFTKPEVQTKNKTDLKKIDSNRKKSASPLQSGGQTNSNHVSLESIDSMSMSEFAKLSPSQLRELESQ